MKTTIILSDGATSIILTPESEIEKQAVKDLSGGQATLITSGNSIFQNNIEGALMIKKGNTTKD